MTALHDLLRLAQDAVDAAAAIVRRREIGASTFKGDRDYATAADFAAEDAVRHVLASVTPDIPLFGEERGLGGAETAPLMWTLDPIDGTVNFAHGLPLCAVSLALLREGDPVLGIIDMPFLGTRFSAVEGSGACQDGKPITVSTTANLDHAVVALGDYAVGIGAEKKNATRLDLTRRLVPAVERIRMLGSAAIDLAWVAAGHTDALIMLSNNAWDVAAGVIIAREAGAAVLGEDGKPHSASSTATIACTPSLQADVARVVAEALTVKTRPI